MGIERMHAPQYWRKRAEEFRTKADNLEHPEAKESLYRVAQRYDELARVAEKFSTDRDAAE